MSHDDSGPHGEPEALFKPSSTSGENLLRRIDEGFDDIPTISHDMLHHERVEFEAEMKILPPVTLALMIACTIVYIRQVWIGGLDNEGRVIATGAMHRGDVFHGELWRLISGAFMHANAEHLVGNMVMLFILGMACEHAFGLGPFLFLYVAACLAGSLAVMHSAAPTVGASGAIFGLAGAVVALIVVRRRQIELRDHRLGIVLAIWVIYTLGLGALNPIVSNSCHMGGLLGGLTLGAILPPALLSDRRELAGRVMTRVQTCLAIVILVASAVFFLPHLN
jgi:membrane associated rhomboid family serine protease